LTGASCLKNVCAEEDASYGHVPAKTKFIFFYLSVKEIHQEMIWWILRAAKTPSLLKGFEYVELLFF